MSKVYRTKGFLTIAQVAHSWAPELVGPGEHVLHCEQNLAHELVEDVLNGRFDASGPLSDGQNSAIHLITPDNKAAIIEKGQELAELAAANPGFFSHHVVLMKEAVLGFAKRRQLPQPSWWSDGDVHSTAQTEDGAKRKRAGKQPRIMIYLAEKFPEGVPDPAIVPRNFLKNELIAWQPNLEPLDEETLKKAIDRYNAGLSARKIDPK